MLSNLDIFGMTSHSHNVPFTLALLFIQLSDYDRRIRQCATTTIDSPFDFESLSCFGSAQEGDMHVCAHACIVPVIMARDGHTTHEVYQGCGDGTVQRLLGVEVDWEKGKQDNDVARRDASEFDVLEEVTVDGRVGKEEVKVDLCMGPRGRLRFLRRH